MSNPGELLEHHRRACVTLPAKAASTRCPTGAAQSRRQRGTDSFCKGARPGVRAPRLSINSSDFGEPARQALSAPFFFSLCSQSQFLPNSPASVSHERPDCSLRSRLQKDRLPPPRPPQGPPRRLALDQKELASGVSAAPWGPLLAAPPPRPLCARSKLLCRSLLLAAQPSAEKRVKGDMSIYEEYPKECTKQLQELRDGSARLQHKWVKTESLPEVIFAVKRII